MTTPTTPLLFTRYVLAYQPLRPKCTPDEPDRSSLLVVTDSKGNVLKVNEVKNSTGGVYKGSLTAVACCWQSIAWGCGREEGGQWQVMRFKAHELMQDLGSPGSPTRGSITIQGSQAVSWLASTMDAEKCTLALAPDHSGRRSAALGFPPRLYVGATSKYPHAEARGYTFARLETLLVATATTNGPYAHDCWSEVDSASESNKFGPPLFRYSEGKCPPAPIPIQSNPSLSILS